jgi:hypothetical protein
MTAIGRANNDVGIDPMTNADHRERLAAQGMMGMGDRDEF